MPTEIEIEEMQGWLDYGTYYIRTAAVSIFLGAGLILLAIHRGAG